MAKLAESLTSHLVPTTRHRPDVLLIAQISWIYYRGNYTIYVFVYNVTSIEYIYIIYFFNYSVRIKDAINFVDTIIKNLKLHHVVMC